MVPRIGFALEQALGHVAYGLGLKRVIEQRRDLEAVWLEVPFDPTGFGRVPGLGRNWTLRGSLRARRLISAARRTRSLDALFIHTQTIGLLSGTHMVAVPTLLSLDATPLNYDEVARWYGDKPSAAPLERAKLLAHRSVMRKAKKLTVWSEWACDSLVRDYAVERERVTVLHPGAVIAQYPAVKGAPRSEGPLRVLFVGGDFKRKGGDLLVKVCQRPSLKPHVELHLVTGAEVAAAPNVFVYKGLKPHSKELLLRYAEADIFALPTRGDCLAVVLGEAMASCLPIITTRVGAQPEAVDEGENGFVIEPDDPDALEDRLLRLVRDRGLLSKMALRSRQIGEARFDMHKNANQIADILVELARSGRA